MRLRETIHHGDTEDLLLSMPLLAGDRGAREGERWAAYPFPLS